MKAIHLKTEFSEIKTDTSLDKYAGKILFPKKHEKAVEFVEKLKKSTKK